jgi:hypothetical protein
MRRFLSAAAMVMTVGAAAVGLYAGVGRAAGPVPASPAADRVLVLPADVVAPGTEPAPVVVSPAAEVAPLAVAGAEPARGEVAASVIVSCGIGADGAFVAVASVTDCPGSAALRIEATTNA